MKKDEIMEKFYSHPDRSLRCEDWTNELSKILKYVIDYEKR